MSNQDQNVQADEARLARLAAFGSKLSELRKEAIDGRKNSGIEEQWQEDDDYYEGVDEANQGSRYLKPTSSSGRPVTRQSQRTNPNRSTVFVNITQPYCDMASARVADMLLPTDDKPFGINCTPVPEVAGVLKNTDMMPGGVHSVGQAAELFLEDMRKRCDKAENQIWDWLIESSWHREVRKVIEQAARLGTGCLKGPVPVKRKKRMMTHDDLGITIQIEDVLKPSSKMIDVWNLYPDPNCGESIHNGSYIFEKDLITKKQLQALRGGNYIDSEIDALLKEGPGKKYVENDRNDKGKDNDQYEIWYFTGQADYDDLIVAGCECIQGDVLDVTVILVNDRIIKASKHILTSGQFPYDVLPWQYKQGSWAGTGVARQVRTSQLMINAAARNLMDNAGVSAGPQIIIKEGIIRPADGVLDIHPLKLWLVDEDADMQQVSHAITSIVIPSMQAELDNIIKMALEFAEKSTSMPLILQGQQGSATETVGGMRMLTNNSNTVLRRIAKLFDDDLTEPHITRYYEWLMMYGEDDSMKGDFTIDAIGSSAFYERDAQNQQITQLIPMAGNPHFGIDPDKLAIEILKMNKISPERVRYSDKEREQMKQAAQENPPQDPKVAGMLQVEQLRQQGEMQKAQLVNQSDMAEIQAKQQAMSDEMALKVQMANDDRNHAMQMKMIDRELKMMELSQAQHISLDKIKAMLAGKTMDLQVQKELSYADINHSLRKEIVQPPTEPIGRAEPGHSYEQ